MSGEKITRAETAEEHEGISQQEEASKGEQELTADDAVEHALATEQHVGEVLSQDAEDDIKEAGAAGQEKLEDHRADEDVVVDELGADSETFKEREKGVIDVDEKIEEKAGKLASGMNRIGPEVRGQTEAVKKDAEIRGEILEGRKTADEQHRAESEEKRQTVEDAGNTIRGL